MKTFLLKTALYGFIISVITISVLMFFGGYVDYFYPKFAAPAQRSLILGDSRSFQGIQPSVIRDELKEFPEPLNYSFTLKQIAYGEAYTNSVKRKLVDQSGDGLFIINVHPWILSEREDDDVANGIFFETSVPPNNMRMPSMNPNIEYFFRNQEYFHFKSLIRRSTLVHGNGWLEEFNLPTDPKTLKKWREESDSSYIALQKRWKPSAYRTEKLSELVRYLNSRGKVVLVRMPVGKNILDTETSYWPSFDREMEKVARSNRILYFDFTKSDHGYTLYDGLHLDKKSGAEFTRTLCDSIKRAL